MSTDQIIGNNLKELRKRLGYTQEEIAQAIGIKRAAYSNYEDGTREMPYDTLEKAADFLGCEAYLLFEDSPSAKNEMFATAFRLTGLTDSDYQEIIRFKDIVKTAVKLDRIAHD